MKKWKQLLLIGLSACMLTFQTADIYAAVDLEARYDISTNQISGWPAGPEITSDTGVLMDADSGILLYDKGGDELRYPASITKIMTLLLAVENSSLDDQVTFTETGVRDISWDSGNIGMQLGEVMSMEDCLYALFIQSANEVAAQIAEYVGGTEQNFIDMMNKRAAEIGCTNTHFTNASGLPDDDHYSTARDMALIMREALKNKTFCKIMKNPTYTIKPTNMNSESRRLHTHHPMFATESPYYYKGCIGGKTGSTNAAGSTLVTVVKRKAGTYIAVTMKAQEQVYAVSDSAAMFDYAYNNFSKVKVDGGSVLVPNGTDINSLTTESRQDNDSEQKTYYLGDYMVGTATVPLVSQVPDTADVSEVSDAEAETDKTETDEIKTDESETVTGTEKTVSASRSLMQILLIIMAVMVLLLIVLIIALVKKEKRYRR